MAMEISLFTRGMYGEAPLKQIQKKPTKTPIQSSITIISSLGTYAHLER
jgi:hypothetical protein